MVCTHSILYGENRPSVLWWFLGVAQAAAIFRHVAIICADLEEQKAAKGMQ